MEGVDIMVETTAMILLITFVWGITIIVDACRNKNKTN